MDEIIAPIYRIIVAMNYPENIKNTKTTIFYKKKPLSQGGASEKQNEK
jgi:hypothetical protein